MKSNTFVPASWALMFSAVLLYLCYPGFMSYDSIQMLSEARSSVNGGIFPTLPVYILRLFDIAGNGPVMMLQVQNFTLLFCLSLIFYRLGASSTKIAILLLLFIAVPTVVGCMLVLWKDVTLTALIVASLSLTFLASLQSSESLKVRQIVKWLALLILMAATLVKFNAITSTMILAVYWVGVFLRHRSKRAKASHLLVILLCMIFSNKVVNGYGFPGLHKLAPNNLVYGIMANDLIGISRWSGISLVPFDVAGAEAIPKSSIEDIKRIYSSLGSAVMHDNNVRSGGLVKLYPAKYARTDIVTAWGAAVVRHPSAYVKYRWDLFSEIIGATRRPTYEPTHFNKIDGNRFGIEFRERVATTLMLEYIKFSSAQFYGKPWFVFLLSSFALLIINLSGAINRDLRLLSNYSFAAAFFNVTPYLLVTLSGEVRYSFVALVLCSIPISVVLLSLRSLRSKGA